MKKPPFTGNPLDVLEPGIPKAKKVLEENHLPVTDENIFIIGAMATKGGNKGLDFLQGKARVSVPKKKPVVPAAANAASSAPAFTPLSGTVNYGVTVGGKTFNVQVSG